MGTVEFMGSAQQGKMETKKRQLHLKLKASNLPTGDAMRKSDPFLVIFQRNKSGAFHYLARTEVISNSLNPVWEELHIDVENLIPSEQPEKRREVILRLEIMDDDGEGKVDPLVTGVYRLDQLMLAKQNSRELALQDGKDASERHGKARIEVTTCHFGDQSELVGSGSDEPVMNGSNESILRLSTESDGILPRQFSEL